MTFTRKTWDAMEIVSHPTKTTGMIKIDEDGIKWEWTGANKRVTAKKA